MTTTDHKRIGVFYMVCAFGFFLVGGVLALLMRAELAQPGQDLVSQSTFNQLFTMHGSIMMFLFAVPMAFGLANFLVPLQIGAPDMAFPRLNALSFWLFLGGGLMMLSSFLTSQGAPAFGWTAYAPLSDAIRSPGAGADLWIVSLIITGLGTILTAVNLITTIVCLRAPGMVMFRMPIFTWNILIVCVMVILAFPVLTSGLSLLWADRHLGSHFFEPAAGGVPVLWQHLFWFFGHPEVYIIALPFFGVVTEIIPVFSRKPLFGYRGFVFATLAIAALSTGVWAHHMFATGAVNLPVLLGDDVPHRGAHGGEDLQLDRHHVAGPPALRHADAVLRRLPGGVPRRRPDRAHDRVDAVRPGTCTDTYFIVAHMHYVLFGTAAFGFFAGLYFWYPKFTGRLLDERLGKLSFWLMFVGFNLTFWPQHLLGLRGMPRRVSDYAPGTGWETLNLVSSVGSAILALSMMVLLVNLWRTWKRGAPSGDDPWGGYSLEWATSSPPPEHNFHSLPPIRSERPVFDARQKAAERPAWPE